MGTGTESQYKNETFLCDILTVGTSMTVAGVTVDGTTLAMTGLTATATELNKNAAVVAGTSSASKTLVLGANKNTDVLALPVSGLFIGAGAGTAVDATAAELNKLNGVTAGTVTASKGLVVDANSALDTSRVTTSRTLGGTGVPAAAGVIAETVKAVTGIAENTATTVLTVTVPNAAHACRIEVDVMGRQGAGGTIGADETVSCSKYIMALSRTAGVASVLTLGAQLGVANAKVAGGDTLTAVLTQSAVGEGVGVTNTHLIQVTIDSTNNSSGNHKCNLCVRLYNANATGVTIA